MKDDFSPHSARQFDRTGNIADFRLLIQQLRHPLSARSRLLDILPGTAQFPYWLVQYLDIEKEGHQVLDGQRLLKGHLPAEVDEHDSPQGRCELHEGVEGRHEP